MLLLLWAFNQNTTKRALLALSLLSLVIGAACRSSNESDGSNAHGVIIVSAPAAGVVRRVLVSEGVRVEAGTPLVEITVQSAAPATAASPGESAEARAARNFQSANAEIEA